MRTRSLIVPVVPLVLISLAVPLSAQTSRAALVRQSDIIFAGTVTRPGVVRVDQVFEKPDAVSLAKGDSVTVLPARAGAGSLNPGMRATFYTRGWIYGRGITVREVGHETIGPQLAAVAGSSTAQLDLVARARQQVNDADLKARIQAAVMVVVGRVEQIRPPAYTGAPARPPRPKRFTEHDPDWQEAIIHVDELLKGATGGERVVVRFPGSRDVAFVGTPRFAAGQEGTFLLQKDTATGSPLSVMAGQSVQAYTALHRLDVRSKQDAPHVRTLMRGP
jgi:hypothetical protein